MGLVGTEAGELDFAVVPARAEESWAWAHEMQRKGVCDRYLPGEIHRTW